MSLHVENAANQAALCDVLGTAGLIVLDFPYRAIQADGVVINWRHWDSSDGYFLPLVEAIKPRGYNILNIGGKSIFEGRHGDGAVAAKVECYIYPEKGRACGDDMVLHPCERWTYLGLGNWKKEVIAAKE